MWRALQLPRGPAPQLLAPLTPNHSSAPAVQELELSPQLRRLTLGSGKGRLQKGSTDLEEALMASVHPQSWQYSAEHRVFGRRGVGFGGVYPFFPLRSTLRSCGERVGLYLRQAQVTGTPTPPTKGFQELHVR